MNIFTRIINNLKYAHYCKLRKKSVAQAIKHANDTDDSEFKKWCRTYVYYTQKCINIPLK